MTEHLSTGWRAAFDEAWASFASGNFGIGAAIAEPDGTIVAAGRNLVAAEPPAEQPLAGNFMAHAEMNAYASLRSFTARGLHLTTTLQPCLMCAATGIFMNIADVEYAAPDEFFDGLDVELWPSHSYTRERMPPSRRALDGGWSQFARVLPLIFTMNAMSNGRAAELARERRPDLAAFAVSSHGSTLRALAAEGATVVDGYGYTMTALA